MIFCGDIAIPQVGKIRIGNIPQTLLTQPWLGNLEGSLVLCNEDRRGALLRQHIVFNDRDGIEQLCTSIPFVAFNIANNHILDAAPITETIANLNVLGKEYVGAGNNINEAEKELALGNFIIISFGWNAINCIYATHNTQGVNPYIKNHILAYFREITDVFPSKKIVCLFHWNYELELYPQPLDREIAKLLIDMGATAIIGCHAHRVQSVEIYKNHPIIYGMGNFAFPQHVYMNGKLKFPSFTSTEYVVELTEDTFAIHEIAFDIASNSLEYVGKIENLSCPFAGMSDTEYEHWFKRYRFQRKALPIMKFSDNTISYGMKVWWILFRNRVTKVLSNYTKANAAIKSVLSIIYDRKGYQKA